MAASGTPPRSCARTNDCGSAESRLKTRRARYVSRSTSRHARTQLVSHNVQLVTSGGVKPFLVCLNS